LKATLASICEQMTSDVELVISDNASEDDTQQLVANVQNRYSNVRYYRSATNEGPDRNYLRVISYATGEYSWLFGSDDLMPAGAIDQVMSILESGHDIYMLDRVECDFDMRPLVWRSWLRCEAPRTFDFSRPGEIVSYLQLATSLGAFFSYLSSIIVKRASWNSIDYCTDFTGTAYSHASILAKLVSDGCTLVYAKRPAVLCRLFNDSFAENGQAKRILLDFEGYVRIADYVFAERPAEHEEVLRLLARERPWWRYSVIANSANRFAWNTVKKVLRCGRMAEWQIRTAEGIGKVQWLTRALVWVKRQLRAVHTYILVHHLPLREVSVSTLHQD
jgi:abequosyltransferase